MRKYKSGTSWCLWRWTDTDSEYITRLHLIKTPWFAVCLHWINKPDPEPYLHDHPVTFLSIVLWGGYAEVRVRDLQGRRGIRLNRVNRFNYIRADFYDRHRIVSVKPHTVTLCFMGPKRREWGFHCTNVCSWEYWKDYYVRQRKSLAVAR